MGLAHHLRDSPSVGRPHAKDANRGPVSVDLSYFSGEIINAERRTPHYERWQFPVGTFRA